jgi:hypothetical protein
MECMVRKDVSGNKFVLSDLYEMFNVSRLHLKLNLLLVSLQLSFTFKLF